MIVYGAKNELSSKDNENRGTEIKTFSAAIYATGNALSSHSKSDRDCTFLDNSISIKFIFLTLKVYFLDWQDICSIKLNVIVGHEKNLFGRA